MQTIFDRYKLIRQYILENIKDLTLAQLNEIPPHFSNNIIWNVAHLISAQQGVCYRPAGKISAVDAAILKAYKPDTKPEGNVDESFVHHIKELFISTINDFENDYSENEFVNYTAWTNRYGTEISNVDIAAEFLLFHEGLHLGVIMSIKKNLKQ
jgi:DinB superfamily